MFVPPTVLRDGPFGRGSAQRWVTAVPGEAERVTFDDEDEDEDEDDGEFGWGEQAEAERVAARPG